MELSWLVVSDPPHDEVDLDGAAELLGLPAAETSMKAKFSAPEIWLALAEEREAADAAGALKRLGLSASVVDARNLPGIPGPAPAASFRFGDEALVAKFEDDEVELPYDGPILGVFCKPPSGFRSPAPERGGATFGRSTTGVLLDSLGGAAHKLQRAEALELTTTLDLYASSGESLSRVSIAQDLVDFSGLGDLKQPSAGGNMKACMAECQRRFRQFTLDARLENVRPRQQPGVGEVRREETRKLFSFGTLGLRSLLESVSPDLKGITQYELGSRLACLMHRQAGGGFA